MFKPVNNPTPGRVLSAYLFAVGAVLVTAALRLALDAYLDGAEFLAFFPAVIAASLIGGAGPGMFAVALSVIAAWYLIFPPHFTFDAVPPGDAFAAVLYVTVAALQVGLIHVLRRSFLRNHELAQQLRRRIADRTRELDEVTSGLRSEAVERERVEAALRQSQKMEAVGQLTAGVAHDFNNILMVVLGSLELLLARLGEREQPAPRRFAQLAMQAAQRGAGLTRQLLAFSRLQPLEPTTVDSNALVGDLRPLLRATLGDRIKCEIDLQREIWPASVDAKQLENALVMLALNAREAMPQGGILTIRTSNLPPEAEPSTQNQGYVLISIADSGAGMSEDVLAKAMDPFFTTKPGHGSGLGLSQVYGFVRQSGGYMRLSSEPGRGTVVNLFLPRGDVSPVRQIEEQAQRA